MDYVQKTSWQLARLAECADPDMHDGIGFDVREAFTPSPGATFLRHVENAVTDDYYTERPEDMSDTAHEIADGAVPVYTHELWKTFVDLAAYTEDISELSGGEMPDDLEKVAGLALYQIAERLATALLEERWRDADGDDDDDDDDNGGITPEGIALGHRYVMGNVNAYCPTCSAEQGVTVLDCDYDLDK